MGGGEIGGAKRRVTEEKRGRGGGGAKMRAWYRILVGIEHTSQDEQSTFSGQWTSRGQFYTKRPNPKANILKPKGEPLPNLTDQSQVTVTNYWHNDTSLLSNLPFKKAGIYSILDELFRAISQLHERISK